jgi:hypothetical protein
MKSLTTRIWKVCTNIFWKVQASTGSKPPPGHPLGHPLAEGQVATQDFFEEEILAPATYEHPTLEANQVQTVQGAKIYHVRGD